ncbi:S8 family peptidase [Indiicoccus explosivorum]|uniref:S8 family peptidase n=1 Tax=Indiicoccus explosivorum TaxID=1917864 RepID=UPI00139054FB|nr:S8 family serine peptidase [Indiicoccus explosivorum]
MRRTLLALILFSMAGGSGVWAAGEEKVLVHAPESAIAELREQNPGAEAFDLLPVIELELTDSQQDALRHEYPEAEIYPVLTYETAADTVPAQFAQIGAQPADTAPYTGKGVKIAIIDTGVDTDHQDLRVAGGTCTMQTGCDTVKPYDDDDFVNGHGTHVAGVIAAEKDGAGIIGIAPDAEIYAVKALNDHGGGPTTAIVAGVEWAIEHDMDIINMSISIGQDDPVLKMMLEEAAKRGILLVAAAGNAGGTDSVTYPAKYPSVIAVSGVSSTNTLLSRSSSGPEVEITAPGEAIVSTAPFELDVADGKQDGYRTLSGTSMAVPHVTGILALYKERFPSFSAQKLRELLAITSKDIGTAGRDAKFGFGLAMYKDEITGMPYLTHQVQKGKVTVQLQNKAQIADWALTIDGEPVAEKDPGLWELYLLAGTYKGAVEYTDTAGKTFTEVFTVRVDEPAFPDVSSAIWYAPQVAYLSHNGWIYGYKDKTFRPADTITRGEAVMMLGRAYGLNGEQRQTVFSDVGVNHSASGFVQSGYEAGLLAGFEDGTFRPDQPVTRAEMAILISNAYGLFAGEAGANPFSDVSPSMAAYEEILALAGAGVTVGYPDGTFRPETHMTRAMFSVFLAKADRPDLFQ